jgi:hypothetical protein
MPNVREIAVEIVAREGGFVNDPDDPGGATNHGVTIHTLRRLGIDVNRDTRIDVADVKALTRAQAVEIYLEHYYTRPGIAALPEALQASVFDMYVNAGGNAVKILQRLLTDRGFRASRTGRLARPRSGRRRWCRRRPRRIWSMPTGSRGGITIILWQIADRPAGNMPGARTVARVAGSRGRKSSSRRSII